MTESNNPIRRMAVIGAGTMGRGIAQLALMGGVDVVLIDSNEDAPGAAKTAIADALLRLERKGQLRGSAQQLLEKLTLGSGPLAENRQLLEKVDLVIEAIIESELAKQVLFAELHQLCSPETIFASNTSSLSISAIAAGIPRKARIVGCHFFNPAPLMRIVEVIPGAWTDWEITETVRDFVTALGHRPVVVKDTPGFLINHLGRGFTGEASRLVQDSVADAKTIDRILCGQLGFRMGPFELLDLIGLDVSLTVMESVYQGFDNEPRYRPASFLRQRVEQGLLGRKSGQGFYQYSDGKKLSAKQPDGGVQNQFKKYPVWIGGAEDEAKGLLKDILFRAGVEIESGDKPGDAALCLVAPEILSVAECVQNLQLDAARTVAVDCKHRGNGSYFTLMASEAVYAQYLASAQSLFESAGIEVSVINDSPGFVAGRVLAMMINIACEIAQQQIAEPTDIDEAVQLGLGYPNGLLAWGDEIGAGYILALLNSLQRFTGDPRYRPSAWLEQHVASGVPLRSTASNNR